MEQITKFAINNSRLTVLLLIITVIAGIFTFVTMPSQEDPTITIRAAQVTTKFPGMSTSLIEDLIAKPLEKKIKEIPELDEIKTTVSSGTVLIEVIISDQYFDMDPIWQNLRNKMNDVKSQLPEGTSGPFVNDDFGDVASATIALYGRGYTMKELQDVSNDLQDKLSQLHSVSKVDLYGIQPEKIYLEYNPSRIAFYGISPAEIVNALKQQNIVLPGGSIVADNNRITIEPSGNFESLEQIRNLQIYVEGSDQTVYLRDIITLKRDYINPPKNPVFFDAQPAIVIGVSMIEKYNIKYFGEELTKKVEELRQTLPVGLEMDFSTYQPTLVKESVSGAVSNLYQTIVIVVAVVIIFLGLRTGLIVGSIVPLTILASLIFMNLWGIDLQRMSIAAIIISLGLLVDNAIVIAEDIRKRMDEGVEKKQASLDAVQSLGLPLLTSSLTTIFAFVPLMLSENVTGEYLRSLSQVVITTLLSSWFLALFATPTLCYWFLKDSDPNQPKVVTSYDGKFYDSYRFLLKFLLKNKIIFIGIMVFLLIISLMGFKKVPTQMMPYSDRNQLLVYIDLPAGSDINYTVKTTQKLTAWLADQNLNPDVENNTAYIGFGGPRFFLSLSPPDPANNVAFMVVSAKTKKDVLPLQKRINQFILDEMPEINGRVKRMSLGASEIGLVEYRIKGPESYKLYEYSHKIEKLLKQTPGTTAIVNDWQNPVSRIKVNIDQLLAKRSGVTSESLARSLNAYYDGYAVTDYREGDKSLPITLRGGEDRNQLSGLYSLPVISELQVAVPLMQIAEFSSTIEPDRLMRENQERTLTVSAKHLTLQASQLHKKLLPAINAIKLDKDYKIEFGGEVENGAESNQALFSKMPIGLIAIAILLVWQFNSFRRPMVILLTIPLTLIGAVAGLLFTGAFLSFTAFLGLFSLAGIIVNNGIVLIDCIDSNREDGLDVYNSVINACVARMRPILMTTLTTILGLIPMLLFGGDLWYPMSIVIISGLAVGSILTLFFVPVLYAVFFNSSFDIKTLKNIFKRKTAV